jgi:hypothetical protein
VLAWSQAVTTGVFTLLGAALGIALGGVVDFGLESRRESSLVRQAKRLVAEELFEVCVHLDHFVNGKHYPKSRGSDSAPLFPNRSWLENRATLAKGLTDEEYRLLSRVGTLLAYVRDDVAEGAPGAPAQQDVVNGAVRLQNVATFAYRRLTGEDWDVFKHSHE